MYQQEAVYYAVEFPTRHILKQQFPSHAAFCKVFHFLRRLQHHHVRLLYGLSEKVLETHLCLYQRISVHLLQVRSHFCGELRRRILHTIALMDVSLIRK